MITKAISLFVLTLATSSFVLFQGGNETGVARAADAPGDQTSDVVYFTTDVMPLIARLGCNVTDCHGSQQGKGGFKLSMFGAEPGQDYEAFTKAAAGRLINKVEPLQSLFLLKATAAISHKGGEKIKVGSPQYNMLASWIARGAPFSDENAPQLVSIKVLLDKPVFQKGETRQLSVAAVFSDGTEKDVTGIAQYSPADEQIAVVDEAGNVKAEGFGQTTVVVSHMRQFIAVRIVVPRPLPSGFPEVETNNEIDTLVLAKLKELGIPPSELCSDHQFIRRVYLDVVGTLPTPDEVRAFLADSDSHKRGKLIDRLLESEEFADFWAMKWGDLFRIKSEYPSNLWPNAVQAYHRWVRDSIARNMPYDQFAKALLTASGSNFRNPPANYFRALLKRDPQNIAEVTALVFMGARIGCARCHGHPSESWGLDDNVGMAAFFAQVRFKKTQEWKEEIVYVNPMATMRHPQTNELVKPKFLDADVIEPAPGKDPRVEFTDWLTSPDNPWFARNIVNRTWFWLLGRGIIHEPDDLRPTNLPENPELLQYLEKELTGNGYDLRHIYRLILNSRTYQLSAKSNELNRHDVAHFSHYQVKRLGAETLLDAIGQVTEKWDVYQSRIPEPFVRLPEGFRATHLADGSIGIPFLKLFGRPPRDTAYESDRDLRLSMRQTLHLLNSSDVQNKINASPRLKKMMTDVKDDSKIVEQLYLATLSRLPTEEEGKNILVYFSGEGKSVAQDILGAKKAAEEGLIKIKAELAKAKAAHQAADKAVKDGETAATNAKAAAAKAAAQQTATADAKTAIDTTLAETTAGEVQARQSHEEAEKAAQQAEVQAKQISDDPDKSDEEKKLATAEVADKRRAADEAKALADEARQKQRQMQSQADADAQKLATAETQKKSAEETLAKVVGEASIAQKQKLVTQAKAKLDKLTADEKTANTKLAEAGKKLSAAKAALKPRRDQAIQDLLWALLNTKEFLFNH